MQTRVSSIFKSVRKESLEKSLLHIYYLVSIVKSFNMFSCLHSACMHALQYTNTRMKRIDVLQNSVDALHPNGLSFFATIGTGVQNSRFSSRNEKKSMCSRKKTNWMRRERESEKCQARVIHVLRMRQRRVRVLMQFSRLSKSWLCIYSCAC